MSKYIWCLHNIFIFLINLVVIIMHLIHGNDAFSVGVSEIDAKHKTLYST
jgi:hypothetical protein